MFFPEFLFRLSQRDEQVTWLDPVLRRISTSTAAAIVESSFTVGEGRVVVLQHAAISSLPGAGQNIISSNLLVRVGTQVATQVTLAFDDVNQAADFRTLFSWQGSILLPAGWVVLASATYNAGVAANETILQLAGISLPIGNIQRV